ncbi:MAG: hypothetical protein JWM58_3924 [Rhizobium sp.]|nr:hypothetical protein [Rhizobium sp.]
MKRLIALGLVAAFSTASVAFADDVTIINKTDPEPTGSVVIKKQQDPDVVVRERKNKIIIKEKRNDPDLVIKGTVNVD